MSGKRNSMSKGTEKWFSIQLLRIYLDSLKIQRGSIWGLPHFHTLEGSQLS